MPQSVQIINCIYTNVNIIIIQSADGFSNGVVIEIGKCRSEATPPDTQHN